MEAVPQLEMDWGAARNNTTITGGFDGWRGKFYTDGEEQSFLSYASSGREDIKEQQDRKEQSK